MKVCLLTLEMFYSHTVMINPLFQAHKVILAAGSDYFHAMFSSTLRESSQNEIKLESLDGTAVKGLLDFIYSGQVDSKIDFIN